MALTKKILPMLFKEQIASTSHSPVLILTFWKKLKADYGNYVTIVYAYIDDTTLQTVTKKYSDKERRERIITSKKIKDVYINNITFFDSAIIYGGEDSAFNFKSLESQLSNIIEKAKTKYY